MAKPKKYITSKLKVKRKFVDGGPYSDTESELYLGKNTYSADMGPTNQMQAQTNLEEQQQKQAQQVYNSSKAQVINAQTDLNKNQELERQRAEEEKQIQEAENKQIEQNMQKQVTSAASLAGKEVAKTVATTSTATKLPTDAAGAVLSKADAKALGVKSASRFAGQGVSKFSYGSNLANLGVGLGFGLAGEGLGYWAKRRQDKIDEGRGYSDYYSDTHYTNREALGQVGKSTLKGAGMGSAFGPVGSAIGAGVGLLYGAGKAVHEKRKASGKNWFGESNVYDENKDPNVIAKKQYEDSLEAQARISSQMDNAFLSSRVTNQNTGHGLTNTIMARTGGKIEYLKGGVAKSLGRGAKEYVGKSHEQGGIDLPGNIEVEGGETEQNNYIFSATLKLPNGQTYARAHKNLIKSGATGEEIHQLALSQEAAAGRNPNEIKSMKFAKYGGKLMYREGGENNPPAEGELDFDTKTKMRLHANEGVSKGGLTTPYLDSKGFWTVGRGHLLTKPDGTPYTKKDSLPAEFGKITIKQVEDWAVSDYESHKKVAQNWIGKEAWEKLPDAVKSGTIELAYGLGSEKIKKFKDTKNFILAGDYESAAENITKSKYFKDVAARRGTQVASLIGGDEEVFDASASKDQYTVSKDKAAAYFTPGKQINAKSVTTAKPSAIGVNPMIEGQEVDLGEDNGNTSGLTATIDRKNLRFESSDNPADEANTLTAPILDRSKITYGSNNLEEDIPTGPPIEDTTPKPKVQKSNIKNQDLTLSRDAEGNYIYTAPDGTIVASSMDKETADRKKDSYLTNGPARPQVTTKSANEPNTFSEVDLGEDTGNSSGMGIVKDRSNLTFGSDNPEDDIITEVTDATTGQKVQLNPERPVDASIVDLKRREEPKPKSAKTPSVEVGPISYEVVPDEKKVRTGDPYRTLAYAAQFAQPAYALLNPYKSKYSEAPVSINAPMAGTVPTVGTNINLSREDFNPIIAGINAQVAAGAQNARNIAGPGGIAAEIALRGKGMQAILDTKAKEADANKKLADAEKQLQLTASMKNQAAAQNAIQMQTQVAAQQAQLDAARGARMATAKEAANQERYTNTGQAIGYAGAGIGTMYRDQNQLDTQYKIALATDPTGSAARWLQSNDPAAYQKYIQENNPKKFGGLKNSYVSRLGQLSKRPLKAKI
jgi:GH24 family phage-related lysozyme (muramidase)